MGPRIDNGVHAVKIEREVMANHGRHKKRIATTSKDPSRHFVLLYGILSTFVVIIINSIQGMWSVPRNAKLRKSESRPSRVAV